MSDEELRLLFQALTAADRAGQIVLKVWGPNRAPERSATRAEAIGLMEQARLLSAAATELANRASLTEKGKAG